MVGVLWTGQSRMVASCGVHGGPGTSLGGVQLQGCQPHYAHPPPQLDFVQGWQSGLGDKYIRSWVYAT